MSGSSQESAEPGAAAPAPQVDQVLVEAVREIARSAGWTVVGSDRPGDISGIVALTKSGVDPDAFVRSLRERGVALACRRARVRISPHVYNDADDLGRLSDALRSA